MVRLTRTAFQRAFNLPRSAFYRPIIRAQRNGDAQLVTAITAILAKHPRFGYRQVTDRLRRERRVVNAKRVLRIMREKELIAKPLRRPKWKGRRGSYGNLPNFSRFTPSAPNQLWLTDITFVSLRSRWIYLAVLLDAFSRRCIGWALGTNITTELTLAALRMALVCRRPKGTLVHHSDCGSQYRDTRYQDALGACGIQQSFSRPGTPTDNPVCERFIGTLKREEIKHNAYVDLADAERSIAALIADYNEHRAHSSLEKRSPIEFERNYHQAAKSQALQDILDVS
jgi:putative transposase